jgi:hypothetical protein
MKGTRGNFFYARTKTKNRSVLHKAQLITSNKDVCASKNHNKYFFMKEQGQEQVLADL